mmetsp:Transcript_1829/g.4016  ORF Transcript_1829/g.4016 Transcript_1829/m.4016 type:complete len:218 (+) Transcript_1829:863-1516(+)
MQSCTRSAPGAKMPSPNSKLRGSRSRKSGGGGRASDRLQRRPVASTRRQGGAGTASGKRWRQARANWRRTGGGWKLTNTSTSRIDCGGSRSAERWTRRKEGSERRPRPPRPGSLGRSKKKQLWCNGSRSCRRSCKPRQWPGLLTNASGAELWKRISEWSSGEGRRRKMNRSRASQLWRRVSELYDTKSSNCTTSWHYCVHLTKAKRMPKSCKLFGII